MNSSNSIIIGIAGRSCSGKSTLAQELHSQLADSAHIDIDHFFAYGAEFNCASPDQIEQQALDEILAGLIDLKDGKSVQFSKYDFDKKLKLETDQFNYEPGEYIIIENALIFLDARIREAIDLKVFVDVPDEVCLQRRLDRGLSSLKKNTKEYAETEDYIRNRWEIIANQWDNYLQSLIKYADIVIPHPERGIERVLGEIERK